MDEVRRLPGEAPSSGTLTSSGASRGNEPLFGRTLLD